MQAFFVIVVDELVYIQLGFVLVLHIDVLVFLESHRPLINPVQKFVAQWKDQLWSVGAVFSPE